MFGRTIKVCEGYTYINLPSNCNTSLRNKFNIVLQVKKREISPYICVLEKQTSSLEQKLQSLSKEIKDINDNKNKKTDEMSKLGEEVHVKENELKLLIDRRDEVTQYKEKLSCYLNRINDKREVAMTELSSKAGDVMTSKNPNITNLGDPNRADKLGDKFNEIYDNEWTDLMEYLESSDKKKLKTPLENNKVMDKSGKKYAMIIVRMTKKALNKVELYMAHEKSEIRKKQIETVKAKINDKSHNREDVECSNLKLEENSKYIIAETLKKDPIKMTNYIASITDALINENYKEYESDALRKFLEKVVEIMVYGKLQDVPMVFCFAKEDEIYDRNHFRVYTHKGLAIVDYAVWPVVYLHEGGPVLFKGVVQEQPIPES
ncbi:MAG: hypothetical protein KAG53_06380 [Endozoicomonadaceae bacterium]|nr:hypothetical protein [Endozoicomonadaceae bacterium]